MASAIEKVALGRTEIRVSRLCLGGWQAAGWQRSDDKVFINLVARALDLGINFIDTAPAYGNGRSEELVGKAIAGRRADVIVATKFAHNDSKPDRLRKSLEQSLQRLGTDYIDLYQQHWPPKSPPLEETVGELEKLKSEGKIRAIGVCNWMEPEWQEISDPKRVECLQPCYSLLWRSIEKEVLPLARKHELAVICYSPLCQGLLTGSRRFTDELPSLKSDPRRYNQLLNGNQKAVAAKVAAAVEEAARRYGRTPAQVALRWLLQAGGVTALIVGATSAAQLEENLGALDFELQASDWQLLDEAGRPLMADIKPHDSLWGWHPREQR